MQSSHPEGRSNGGSVTVSLSMIVKDEESYLAGCLDSVKGVVDEIVVVDTGSKDRTIEIARDHGAAVHSVEWAGDFSAARNESLNRCSGDWVLYLDADERLAAGQEGILRTVIADRRFKALSVTVRSRVATPAGSSLQYLHYPRLFQRDRRIRFEGRVHEQIAPSIARIGGAIGASGLVIEHLGYDRDDSLLQQKQRRNLGLLLEDLRRGVDDPYVHYQLGNVYVLLDEYENARVHLDVALASTLPDPPLRAAILNQSADLEIRTGRFNEAVGHCLESIRLAQDQTTAHWYLAGAYIHLHDYTRATEALNKLLHLPQEVRSGSKDRVIVDLVVARGSILKVKGQCEAADGNPGAAVDSLFEACRQEPDAEDTVRALVEIHEQLGDPVREVRQLEQLAESSPHRGLLPRALARAYAKAGRLSESAETLRQLLRCDAGDVEASVLLVQLLLDGGDLEEATRALAEAESRETDSFALARCGFDLAVRRGNLQEALDRVHQMLATTPPGNPALREKLRTLALKYESAVRCKRTQHV